jgi:hypothetical protein
LGGKGLNIREKKIFVEGVRELPCDRKDKIVKKLEFEGMDSRCSGKFDRG